MPNYEFRCKECSHVFEHLCTWKEYDDGFPGLNCPECQGSIGHTLTVPGIIGTSSKMDNFEYAAEKNMDKARVESSTAREQAKKLGIESPYGDVPDFTDNGRRMNFID